MADYASLLIDAGEYAGRTDFAHLFQDFVRRAEAKFNAALRVSQMESYATLSTVDGKTVLPSDYLDSRSVVSGGRELYSASLQYLMARYGSRGGMANSYAIVGNELQLFPRAPGDVGFLYYAKIPPLTPTNPTNWLIEQAEQVYLYGVVEEIGIWEANPDKVGAVGTLKANALRDLMINDERGRWGNSRISIGGLTP